MRYLSWYLRETARRSWWNVVSVALIGAFFAASCFYVTGEATLLQAGMVLAIVIVAMTVFQLLTKALYHVVGGKR